MDERLRFIARLLEGEKMAPLCREFGISRRKINLSTAFAGQTVGVREVENQIWLVSFLDYGLGYFDTHHDDALPIPTILPSPTIVD